MRPHYCSYYMLDYATTTTTTTKRFNKVPPKKTASACAARCRCACVCVCVLSHLDDHMLLAASMPLRVAVCVRAPRPRGSAIIIHILGTLCAHVGWLLCGRRHASCCCAMRYDAIGSKRTAGTEATMISLCVCRQSRRTRATSSGCVRCVWCAYTDRRL